MIAKTVWRHCQKVMERLPDIPCLKCEHGVRNGRVCWACGGSGLRRNYKVLETLEKGVL